MPQTSTPRRPVHHSLMAILFPPLAHWHHRRYQGKPHHFVLDSALNVVMLGIALWVGVGLWFLTQASGIGIHIAPTTIRNNESTALFLTIQNHARQPLEHATVAVQAPRSWSLETPSAEVALGTVQGLAQKDITVVLIPHGTPQQSAIIRVLVQGQRGSMTVTQSAQMTVRLAAMPVTITATHTKGSLGHPMTVHLTLTSQSDVTMDHILLQPLVSSALPVVSSVPKLSQQQWTIQHLMPQTNQEFIVTLLPGKAGDIDLPIRLASNDQRFILDRVQHVRLTIAPAASATDLITTPSQAGANIATEALYYSTVGFQFGYGAIPLRVGQETSLRIFWYVHPSTTSATGASMTTVLPAGVQWKGNTSVTAGSSITYDPNQRRVRWAVGSWNASQDVISGSFDVSLVPTGSQVGTFPAVTQASLLTYFDAAGRTHTVRSGGATTRTIDPRNPGAGKVQK